MLVHRAVTLLSRFGSIQQPTDHHYRAVVAGTAIEFIDRASKVARLRMQKPGSPARPMRSVTRALQHALTRGRTLPVTRGPHQGMLVSASVERRGRTFTPCASFMVVAFGGATPLVEGDEWADDDALASAAGFVDGRLGAPRLLTWLAGRGGKIGHLLGSRR